MNWGYGAIHFSTTWTYFIITLFTPRTWFTSWTDLMQSRLARGDHFTTLLDNLIFNVYHFENLPELCDLLWLLCLWIVHGAVAWVPTNYRRSYRGMNKTSKKTFPTTQVISSICSGAIMEKFSTIMWLNRNSSERATRFLHLFQYWISTETWFSTNA